MSEIEIESCDNELDIIDTLNKPNELLVVNIGELHFSRRKPDLVIDRVDSTALGRLTGVGSIGGSRAGLAQRSLLSAPRATRASTSSASFAIEAVRFSCPSALIVTSSSMRTPIPR